MSRSDEVKQRKSKIPKRKKMTKAQAKKMIKIRAKNRRKGKSSSGAANV